MIEVNSRIGAVDIYKSSVSCHLMKLIKENCHCNPDPIDEDFSFYHIEDLKEEIDIESLPKKLQNEIEELLDLMDMHEAWWARFN